MVTVRIATLNRARGPGAIQPSAPQYAPARRVLEFRDQRHGGQLRGAGDRPAGEQRLEHLHQADVVAGTALHGRGQLPERRIRLGPQQVADLDAPRIAHAREVVAQQVHDHHVLRAVLLARAQRLPGGAVLLWAPPPRCGALHRRGAQPVALPGDERFRARTDHGVAAQVQEGVMTAALAMRELPVQSEGVPGEA